MALVLSGGQHASRLWIARWMLESCLRLALSAKSCETELNIFSHTPINEPLHCVTKMTVLLFPTSELRSK
jgi:hypothetical protein